MELGESKEIYDRMGASYLREDDHWGADLDVIKSSINSLLPTAPNLKYLDAGCGPGFHLGVVGELYPEIVMTGLDYSPAMIKSAESRLKNLNVNNVALIQESLISFTPSQKYDVITFLNNGLYQDGTAPEMLRKTVIEKLKQSLSPNGCLIISVYGREALNPNYGPNLTVRPESDITNGDLFVDYKMAGEITSYYSHWFTESEIRQLIEDTGLKIDFFEKRMARFVLRAR